MEQTQFFLKEEDIKIDPNFVFVILPFKYTFVFEKIIKPVLNEFGLKGKKADDLFTTGTVIQDIVNSLRKSAFVIADLTDKNANVFYELGLAHSLKKSVILITQKDEDIPSDLKVQKYYKYDITSSNGIINFENNLRKIIETNLYEKLIIEESLDIYDIQQSKGNELQIASSFLTNNEGTISIWAYISDEHYKYDSKIRYLYLISHAENKGHRKKIKYLDEKNNEKQIRIYLNVFAILRLIDETLPNKGLWRFWCNSGDVQEIRIDTTSRLENDWHLFTVSWSKNQDFIKFYIDTELIGSESFYFWPKNIEKHVFIGTWPTRDSGHYFNSKIGPWKIYRNSISYETIEKYYKENKPKN